MKPESPCEELRFVILGIFERIETCLPLPLLIYDPLLSRIRDCHHLNIPLFVFDVFVLLSLSHTRYVLRLIRSLSADLLRGWAGSDLVFGDLDRGQGRGGGGGWNVVFAAFVERKKFTVKLELETEGRDILFSSSGEGSSGRCSSGLNCRN